MNTPVFTSLRLQNVRSYADFAVELAPSVNIVVGPNASGKTNLLEALLILSGSSSYRASYSEVIANNQTWARIDGDTVDGPRVVKLVKTGGLVDRNYEINEKPKKRLGFNDKLPIILFEPEHMRLLTGSPQHRRDFIDEILTATLPGFSGLLARYQRVIAQRNHLLKNYHQTHQSQLFAWNIRLAELAGQIVLARVNLIKMLNSQLAELYSGIAQVNTKVTANYASPLPVSTYETSLLHKLENDLNLDIAKGFTTYGPHREDISILINEQPAVNVASRGETRTLVIALKLLTLQIIEQARQRKPLILLDDVFSELDGSRRTSLTKRLQGYQTIITTTDADIIGKSLTTHAAIIAI
jgi:DNA replication and repair protein RecF